jgi:hypothetical protein
LKSAKRWFYLFFFLFHFGTASSFAQTSAKCVVLLTYDHRLAPEGSDPFETLRYIHTLIDRPPKVKVLELSRQLAFQISDVLQAEGYVTYLRKEPETTYLTYYVPARWVVFISSAPETTWLGRKMRLATEVSETDFYFDPFGLMRNGSNAAADYTGRTLVGLGKGIYDHRKENFIEGVNHEIHHGDNHLNLKMGKDLGLYAEVNLDSELIGSGLFETYKLTTHYPRFFNFDEIYAHSIDYLEVVEQLRVMQPGSEKFEALTQAQEYYKKSIWQFVEKALKTTKLALAQLNRSSFAKDVVLTRDNQHQRYKAQIPLYDKESSNKIYLYTAWLVKSRDMEKSEENYLILEKSLQKILTRLRGLKKEFMITLPLSP